MMKPDGTLYTLKEKMVHGRLASSYNEIALLMRKLEKACYAYDVERALELMKELATDIPNHIAYIEERMNDPKGDEPYV